ncbi:hypothetical protein NL676_006281 [Syzygium grande]|nr:hypothetical protein NL676_006281 [Syzygium grande]
MNLSTGLTKIGLKDETSGNAGVVDALFCLFVAAHHPNFNAAEELLKPGGAWAAFSAGTAAQRGRAGTGGYAWRGYWHGHGHAGTGTGATGLATLPGLAGPARAGGPEARYDAGAALVAVDARRWCGGMTRAAAGARGRALSGETGRRCVTGGDGLGGRSLTREREAGGERERRERGERERRGRGRVVDRAGKAECTQGGARADRARFAEATLAAKGRLRLKAQGRGRRGRGRSGCRRRRAGFGRAADGTGDRRLVPALAVDAGRAGPRKRAEAAATAFGAASGRGRRRVPGLRRRPELAGRRAAEHDGQAEGGGAASTGAKRGSTRLGVVGSKKKKKRGRERREKEEEKEEREGERREKREVDQDGHAEGRQRVSVRSYFLNIDTWKTLCT